MNKKRNKYAVYSINNDPDFFLKQHNIKKELQEQLQFLINEIDEYENLDKNIEKLLKLIEEYPGHPEIKNFLAVAYKNLGDTEKATEVIHWTVREHPDYLFGRINLANEYFSEGKYEKMKEILGPDLDLQALYPEREIFHESEITSFIKTTVLYFVGTGNLEAAESRLKTMKELFPESPETQTVEEIIYKAHIFAFMDIVEEEREKIRFSHSGNTLPEQTDKGPEFTNALVKELYKNDLFISRELVREILSLPRESLIRDLELVLKDTMRRYDIFREFDVPEDVEFGEEAPHYTFPLHALMMLGELKARESLPVILEVLRQDGEFLLFWFGDHLYETIWEPVYKIAEQQLDVLKRFMQEPGVVSGAKALIKNVVIMVAFHQPEREEEIKKWYADLLDFYINCRPEDNVIDNVAISFFIHDITSLRYKELLPRINVLFKKGYVNEILIGDFKTLKKQFDLPLSDEIDYKLMDMMSRYDEIINSWEEYAGEEDDDFIEDDYWEDDLEDTSYSQEPILKEKKVGRNDPCPCGSGKKYKKCCMNKEK